MLFNSWTFLLFFVVVMTLYYLLPFKAQNWMLLIASYVFYGAWDWRFLGLLALSTTIDYYLGHLLYATREVRAKKRLIVVSCIINLGILGFFKYYNFFIDSAGAFLRGLGIEFVPPFLHVILPVGVSFYTFQSMSYTIDIYRGHLKPIEGLHNYATLVAFFPQLVAGPIVRPVDLGPQILRPRHVTRTHLTEGAWLILWGFFKKVVVADNLAPVVDRVFSSPVPVSGVEWMLAVYAFAFQIYGDFSGYTDIARGLGKCMGIELSFNFNLPYIATNPAEFWKRWHISLSSWLRDYLYIPLGGNRGTSLQTYRNLMLTMLLGGLWHGAAWNFILWGAYQGALLAIHRAVSRGKAASDSFLLKSLKVFGMFQLTCFGWFLFRAGSLAQIKEGLVALVTNFTFTQNAASMLFPILFFPGILFAFEAWLRNVDNPATRPGWKLFFGPATVGILLILIIFFSPIENASFLYFQF